MAAGHGAGLMVDSLQVDTVAQRTPPCLLYNELLNSMRAGIAVVGPPVPAAIVPPNHPVTLKVQAEGPSKLSYQWFTHMGGQPIEIPDETKPNLVVRLTEKQSFVCRVSDQQANCVFSPWTHVVVLNSSVPETWDETPHIVVNPEPQMVNPGEPVTLKCDALGVPPPSYQWYRNGCVLDKHTSKELQIKKVNASHVGTYLCCVSNVNGESWTEGVEIEMAVPNASRLTATDKVALLIGNLNYHNHPRLMAPTMDVYELAQHLRQLDFRVVSLLDLSRDEMSAAIEKFLQLLDKGVYGLFYYAGHGYEEAGRNYMIPIDAPKPYMTSNCVCVQRVMKDMQDRDTALNVILLDTCRKWPRQSHNISEIRPLAPRGNTVYGYATCEDAEAFEVQDARGKSTGIFTKYLNKHILRKEKVTHILERVSEDMYKDPLVAGKQVCEIKITLSTPRALTDPVSTTGHTCEVRIRDSSWRRANALPERELIDFPIGAKVELSFSALFSNVLVVFATVRDTGENAQDCAVSLRSLPGLGDIFSGNGGSEDMDSLLMTQADGTDSSIRLCNIHRLQTSLKIEVDLHYTDIVSRQRLTESRSVSVGKPLVAACSLTPARPPGTNGSTQGPHSCCDQRRHNQTRPSPQPHTRKAENAMDDRGRVPTATRNQPEENDESDLQNFICQRILSSLHVNTHG